jgi:DNA-binding transcriptional LysR family regulator
VANPAVDNQRNRSRLVSSWDNLSELESVRVFAAVAELKSFRGAALALGIPRSTVSRRLAALESELETRLLQRTTRQVTLTVAGTEFLKQVSPALAALGDARRAVLDARAEPRGLLRLTATPPMAELLGDVLMELLERYPDLRLEIDFTDRAVDLVAEGYDIALRTGALADSSLVARPLGSGISGYYASRAYLKKHGRPKQPADLARHTCVIFSGSPRGARWRFLVGKREQETMVQGRLVANSLALARFAAARGHGITWLPEALARDSIADGSLVPVLADFWPAPIPIQLVYPSARHLAPQVRVAVDLLTSWFSLRE